MQLLINTYVRAGLICCRIAEQLAAASTTTGIERAQYLPLLWPVRQSGAADEHNDVILYLCLHTTDRVKHTPISSCLFVLILI